MNIILVLLLVAAMGATLYVLVRGVMTMAQGKEFSSEQQQQWMRRRVQFQAVAVILVVLILLAAGTAASWGGALVKLNRIYTRTGDAGTAGLVDGSRVPKCSSRMHAIGEIDEANSAIGVALALVEDGEQARRLRAIQNELFDLGADIATPGDIEGALRITAGQVERLEREIDALNAGLAPLTSFILPGGSPAAASLYLARAVVRRAERAAVALHEAEPVNPQALAYLNRLSDHLFVLARHVAQSSGGDILWQPGATR